MRHSSPEQPCQHLHERKQGLRAIRALAVTLLIVLTLAPSLFAQKTDTVTLYNGDRITGEIKELNRGQLKYSTDDMGTLYIEWVKIARLFSRKYFEVQLETGERYYGSLPESPQDGRLEVRLTENVSDTLNIHQVVSITRINANFWSRLDGSVNIGFSYASTNKVLQLNTAFNVKYRGEKYSGGLDYSGYWQMTDSTAATTRNNINLSGQKFFKKRWSYLLYLQADENQSLNLDLRLGIGTGAVYQPIQKNRSLLGVSVGPLVTREVFTTGDTPLYSLEVLFAGDLEAFRYDSPKLNFTTTLSVVPSLTTWGRVRITFNSTLSYELFSDFTVGFTIYDAFDNEAGDTDAANDLTTTASIGYTF